MWHNETWLSLSFSSNKKSLEVFLEVYKLTRRQLLRGSGKVNEVAFNVSPTEACDNISYEGIFASMIHCKSHESCFFLHEKPPRFPPE